jgi:regulatory protein YycH of two-component signal transduction system YycFG
LPRDCFITTPEEDIDIVTNIQTQTTRILPTAPRTLTQAQIYTINQIMKNRESNTTYRGKAPTTSDTFALIPIKHEGMNTGEMYVEFSGSLQESKRIYFGPVDIDRMHIKLLDDRGYVLDLHGVDWCITLISENLYQY